MTFPPAAAVMTRRKFAGMRSAIVTSHVIGGAHSVAAEIPTSYGPRLIKLCYANASVRLGQKLYEAERRNLLDLRQRDPPTKVGSFLLTYTLPAAASMAAIAVFRFARVVSCST